jgi:SAM-dependent methyltransferase
VFCEDTGFRAVRCETCSFVTLHSGLDEAQLGRAYQDYLPEDPASIERWRAEQQPVIDRAAGTITRLCPPGRLLDLGCGFGFFLAAMAARGFEVEGLEVSATGRRYAQHELGVKVHPGILEPGTFPDHSFAVVTAFYVIEHVPDPLAFLREIHRLLRPGGLVFLRWPHSTPLVRVLEACRIRHDLYHRPWHLSDFSPRTMHRALQESGFRSVTTRTLGGTASGSFWQSLLSRGAAHCSDGIEWLSAARFHLPGVSKSSWGFRT